MKKKDENPEYCCPYIRKGFMCGCECACVKSQSFNDNCRKKKWKAKKRK